MEDRTALWRSSREVPLPQQAAEDVEPTPWYRQFEDRFEQMDSHQRRQGFGLADELPQDVANAEIYRPLLAAQQEFSEIVENHCESEAAMYEIAVKFIVDGYTGRLPVIYRQRHPAAECFRDFLDGSILQISITVMMLCDMWVPLFFDLPFQTLFSLIAASVYILITIIKIITFGKLFFKREDCLHWQVLLIFSHFVIVLVVTIRGSSEGLSADTVTFQGNAQCQLLLGALIVGCSKTLQQTLRVVVLTIRDCAGVIVFMLMVLATYGYLGCIAFRGLYEYPGQIPNDDFDGLSDSMLADFVLMTSENYPSVALQAYAANKGSLIYFVTGALIFLILKDYMLSQVEIAFHERLTDQVCMGYSAELRGYANAFLLMTAYRRNNPIGQSTEAEQQAGKYGTFGPSPNVKHEAQLKAEVEVRGQQGEEEQAELQAMRPLEPLDSTTIGAFLSSLGGDDDQLTPGGDSRPSPHMLGSSVAMPSGLRATTEAIPLTAAGSTARTVAPLVQCSHSQEAAERAPDRMRTDSLEGSRAALLSSPPPRRTRTDSLEGSRTVLLSSPRSSAGPTRSLRTHQLLRQAVNNAQDINRMQAMDAPSRQLQLQRTASAQRLQSSAMDLSATDLSSPAAMGLEGVGGGSLLQAAQAAQDGSRSLTSPSSPLLGSSAPSTDSHGESLPADGNSTQVRGGEQSGDRPPARNFGSPMTTEATELRRARSLGSSLYDSTVPQPMGGPAEEATPVGELRRTRSLGSSSSRYTNLIPIRIASSAAPDIAEEYPTITANEWRRLVQHFHDNQQTNVSLEGHSFADLTFMFRDENCDDRIELMEFLALAELLKFEIMDAKPIEEASDPWHEGGGDDALLPGLRSLIDSHLFATFSACCIFSNCCILWVLADSTREGEQCNRNHDESVRALIIACLVFFGLLTCELLARFLGRGFCEWRKSIYNWLDALVWLATLSGLIVGCTDAGQTTTHADDCLRTWGCQWKWVGLMIFRIFGMLRYSLWSTEYSVLWWVHKLFSRDAIGFNIPNTIMVFNIRLLEAAARTFSLLYFTGSLLLMILYTWAVVGVLVFEDSIELVNKKFPQAQLVDDSMTNFSSVGHAVIAMFQVLIENNWNDILYTTAEKKGAAAIIFFVLFFVLCAFFFLNIFTAIILNSVNKNISQSFAAMDVNQDGVISREEWAEHRERATSESVNDPLWTFDIPHEGILYRLRRRPRPTGLELQMDLMDSTKARLLQQCLAPTASNKPDSWFSNVFVSAPLEIEDDPAEANHCCCQ